MTSKARSASGRVGSGPRGGKSKDSDMVAKGYDMLQNLVKDVDKEEDDFDVFGKLVASELRKIKNPYIFMRAKRQITNLLYSSQEEDQFPTATTMPPKQFHTSQYQPSTGPYQPPRPGPTVSGLFAPRRPTAGQTPVSRRSQPVLTSPDRPNHVDLTHEDGKTYHNLKNL